jgi:membrane protease YdiL (CAAX protease family)
MTTAPVPALESREANSHLDAEAYELLHPLESRAQAENTALAEEPAPYISTVPPYVQEDLRVPWGWLDLFFLVVLAVSGVIVLGLLFTIGFAMFGGDIRHLQDAAITNFAAVVLQAVADVGLLAFLAAQMRVRFHLPFWRTVGFRPLRTERIPRALAYFGLVVGGALLAILVTLASAIWPPKGELPIQQMLQDRHTLILFSLMAVFIAPVVEETLFRGYLYPVVARSFGLATGIVTTGVIFGLLHASQLSGGYWQIALLVVVGIIFTLVRATTRTVTASYLLHVSYNSLQVVALLIDTHWFRQMPSLH